MNNRKKSHEALVCTHCGEKNRMLIITSTHDTIERANDHEPPFEAGTLYELQECPSCGCKVLVGGEWHEMMEGPDDWVPSVLLPDKDDREARSLLKENRLDLECMRLAVDIARKCMSEGDRITPKVGAVIAQNGTVIQSAFRGELTPGEHAEFTLLERKCPDIVLSGSTVYTTLEPCTTRNEPKIPCVDRLVRRKVARVVIGMLDPDVRIRGNGILTLRRANIRVDLFPPELMTEIEELNRNFISAKENSNTTIGHASDMIAQVASS